MAPNCLGVALFAVFVVSVNSQLTCPQCASKYDPSSCDGEQLCGVDWNFCELRVHTADYYSLEYVCQEHTNCTNHEIFGCHPEVSEVCAYCCEDTVTCKIQRDDLFTFVFPTAGPPGTTQTPAPGDTTVPAGPTFSCPKCTDHYDYKSCTATQECSLDTHDICMLDVDTTDRNRVSYSCHKYSDCPNYDLYGCNVIQNKVCSYCCLDPVSCHNQREDLFNFVFPPIPVTMAPKVVAVPPV